MYVCNIIAKRINQFTSNFWPCGYCNTDDAITFWAKLDKGQRWRWAREDSNWGASNLIAHLHFQLYYAHSAVLVRNLRRMNFNLETMVSRLECTRVHFDQVSVSRPYGQGIGLGLKTACLVPMPVARLPWFVAPLSECCVTSWNWCSQWCDLETMVSRLECTRVHFVQVSVPVSVSRPNGQGLGLGLETWWPRLILDLEVSLCLET